MTVGGFFKSLGHGIKVAFTDPKALNVEAGIAKLFLPEFAPLIDSAKNAIINAEVTAIAAGTQTGTGPQKFAIAAAQFVTTYTSWATKNGIVPTNEHMNAILQKVFELVQLAPELIMLEQTVPVPSK